jgi:hypothetical protein
VKVDFKDWIISPTHNRIRDRKTGEIIYVYKFGKSDESPTEDEYWECEEQEPEYCIGHAATGVGYILASADPPADSGLIPNKHYAIVHDTWASTPRNIAIPWENWIATIAVDVSPPFCCRPNPDVSGDGKVSTYDAALIMQYVVGLISEFPVDLMVSPSTTEQHDYELNLPDIETLEGGKIQVPISVNDSTGLLAGGITIKYDSAVLKAVDYAPLKLLNGYYWKANTNLPGEVRFAFASVESTEGQGNLLMVEFEVLPNTEGKTSPLIIENANLSNSRSIRKINGEVRVIPSSFALLQNFPNPFNPDTWLPYKLASSSPVSISIYNAKGQLIRTLHLGYQNAGVYASKGKAAYWDGRDSLGEKVTSGVYFYTIRAEEFRATRKMVILK